MTVLLLQRRLLIASFAPMLLCAWLAFVLDARMTQGASAALDPANANCFATLGNSTQFSSGDASAVQQAVDAAGPDALVKVAGDCAGVQVRGGTTATVQITQSVTLQGGYTTSNWIVSDPAANPTILDAKGLGTVITAGTVTNLVVMNLTVRNGKSGGIDAGTHLTLSQVMVINNAPGGGASASDTAFVTGSQFISNANGVFAGGLGVYNSLTKLGSATVINSQFISNVGTPTTDIGGGGLAAIDATVIHSQFTGNQALGSGGFGGGLGAGRLSGTGPLGSATVIESQFISNTAAVGGGGLHSVGTLFITNTGFTSNTADYSGGAHASSTATVSGGYFWDNHASTFNGALGASGPVSLGGGYLIVSGTQFVGNTSSVLAGGLSAIRPLTISGALFQNNRCTGTNCKGGALLATDALVITDSQFLGNTATDGGAVYASNGGSLHNSCVVGNQQVAVTNISGTLNAANNWWGAANGPSPIGSGDAITGAVTATPFLTTTVFDCPSLGFGMRLYLPIIER